MIMHHLANTILENAGVALRCVYILVALCSTDSQPEYLYSSSLMAVPTNIDSPFGHWSLVSDHPFSSSLHAGYPVSAS